MGNGKRVKGNTEHPQVKPVIPDLIRDLSLNG